MKKMYIAWISLILLIMATLLYIAYGYNKSVEDYKIIEHDLVEAAQSFVIVREIKPTKQELKITYEDLVSENLKVNMKVDEDECSGYVIVKKNLSDVEYKAYIDCKNYKTD